MLLWSAVKFSLILYGMTAFGHRRSGSEVTARRLRRSRCLISSDSLALPCSIWVVFWLWLFCSGYICFAEFLKTKNQSSKVIPRSWLSLVQILFNFGRRTTKYPVHVFLRQSLKKDRLNDRLNKSHWIPDRPRIKRPLYMGHWHPPSCHHN